MQSLALQEVSGVCCVHTAIVFWLLFSTCLSCKSHPYVKVVPLGLEIMSNLTWDFLKISTY